MTAIRGAFFATCAALVIAAPGQATSYPTADVAAAGTTRFQSGPVSIVIVTSLAPQGLNKKPPLACSGGRIRCSLLDRLVIRVNGREILIPKTAIVSLADISRVTILPPEKGRYKVTLDCGDASEGYEATLIFNRERLLQRDIQDGEAGMLAERTTYEDLSHAFDD